MLWRGTFAAALLIPVMACAPTFGEAEPGGTTIGGEAETGGPTLLRCERDEECFPDEGVVCEEVLGICENPSLPGRGVDCGGDGRGTLDDGVCICDEGYSDAFVPQFCCKLDGPDEICGNYQAMPGQAGGVCLAPNGTCSHPSLVCDPMRNVCLHAEHACFGVTCGGLDRGLCAIDAMGEPQCTCSPGFDNEMFKFYCCPADGSDPLCP